MTDEQYTFEQTRVRLEGILVEVRKKDTSLEQSLELLEEGVRLLNQCNELIDQTAWRPAVEASEGGEPSGEAVAGEAASKKADSEEAASDETASEVSGEEEPVAPAGDASAEDSAEASESEALPDDERD